MLTIQIRLLMDPELKRFEISEEQCSSIRDKVSYLHETAAEIDYCLILRENLLDAFNDFKTNGAGIPNNFIRLNRCLMNWLNTFYTWIEYHERHYKDLFSELKSKYYDDFFSYRFAYHMRRYTTHQSLCISRITFDVLKETTKYIIPIDVLLENGKEIKVKFRHELEEIKPDNPGIDLEIFTKEFLVMFESFQGEIWKSIIPEADNKYNDLIKYCEQYKDKMITGFRVCDDDTKIIDVQVALKRYLEKKHSLFLPDALKQYME